MKHVFSRGRQRQCPFRRDETDVFSSEAGSCRECLETVLMTGSAKKSACGAAGEV